MEANRRERKRMEHFWQPLATAGLPPGSCGQGGATAGRFRSLFPASETLQTLFANPDVPDRRAMRNCIGTVAKKAWFKAGVDEATLPPLELASISYSPLPESPGRAFAFLLLDSASGSAIRS